jgi:ferredoxin-NADP reductase/Na+-transporting NADH:ubiquinone oxidoreductase subunit NqrB
MKKILQPIDNFLNSITMYRLVLYGLIVLAAQAVFFSVFGILPYEPLPLLASASVLIVSCYILNELFARVLKVPANSESVFITALILFLILAPLSSVSEIPTLFLASALSMGSKYIVAIRKKHIFNPAAFAAFVLGVFGSAATTWWVGSSIMTPLVLVVGLLIVRKLRRPYLFFSFAASALLMILIFGVANHMVIPSLMMQVIMSWPLFFFGTVMLTEPLTTPPTRPLQIMYGAGVGVLFGSQFHVGPVYSTPELALLVGNIFSYLVSSKQKLILTLKEKIKVGSDIYHFTFTPDQKLQFKAGQYVEWTVPRFYCDSRGNRRYFTIASSPTEKEVMLGVKIPAEGASSFKRTLMAMKPGETILASQLSGDFTLPTDPNQKLVFIAGGIGITPFRSMVQTLMNLQQKRDMTLFYACASPQEFAYKELFDEAAQKIGIKVVYVITKPENVPPLWTGKVGRLNAEIISAEVPNCPAHHFYLSGPNAMVEAYKMVLQKLQVSQKNIVTDYFPGF